MAIRISCDQCGSSFRLPANAAGRTVRCKTCESPIRVPAAAGGDGDLPPLPNPRRTSAGGLPPVVRGGKKGRPAGSPSKGSGKKNGSAKHKSKPSSSVMPPVIGLVIGGLLVVGLVGLVIVQLLPDDNGAAEVAAVDDPEIGNDSKNNAEPNVRQAEGANEVVVVEAAAIPDNPAAALPDPAMAEAKPEPDPIVLPPEGALDALEEWTADYLKSRMALMTEEKNRTEAVQSRNSVEFSGGSVFRVEGDENLVVRVGLVRTITRAGESKGQNTTFRQLSPPRAGQFGASNFAAAGNQAARERISDAVRIGDWSMGHNNGLPYVRGQYQSDKRHGVFQVFNDAGEMIWIGQYLKGDLISSRVASEDGSFFGERAMLVGHRPHVSTSQFSPDGAWLATGDPNGRVQIRSVETLEVTQSIELTGPIGQFAFSPDSNVLAISTDPTAEDSKPKLHLWSFALEDAPSQTTTMVANSNTVLRFSDDGMQLTYRSPYKRFRIVGGKLEPIDIGSTIPGRDRLSVPFSDVTDDEKFGVQKNKRGLEFFNLADGGQPIYVEDRRTGYHPSLFFSDRPQLLHLNGDINSDGESTIVDAATGKTRPAHPRLLGARVTASPHRSRLITWGAGKRSWSKHPEIWDVQNGELTLFGTLPCSDTHADDFRFLSTPQLLAQIHTDYVQSGDDFLLKPPRVWNLETGSNFTLRGHSKPLTSISGSPDDRFVLSSSEDGLTMLWDLDTVNAVLELDLEQSSLPRTVAVTREGEELVREGEFVKFAITVDPPVLAPLHFQYRLAGQENWRPVWNAEFEVGPIAAGATTVEARTIGLPGEPVVGTASIDVKGNPYRDWEIIFNEELEGYSVQPQAAADGTIATFGTGFEKRVFNVWQLPDMRPVKTNVEFPETEIKNSHFAVSSDGRFFAFTGLQPAEDINQHVVSLYDAKSGKLLRDEPTNMQVTHLWFAPEGQLMATGLAVNTTQTIGWSIPEFERLIAPYEIDKTGRNGFMPGGNQVLTADIVDNDELALRPLSNMEAPPTREIKLERDIDPYRGLQVSPDGKLFAGTPRIDDGTVLLFSLDDGRLLNQFRVPPEISALQFLPDGRGLLLISGKNRLIVIRDTASTAPAN